MKEDVIAIKPVAWHKAREVFTLINKVPNILSTCESPEGIVLMLAIQFKTDPDTTDITGSIERVQKAIKEKLRLRLFRDI